MINSIKMKNCATYDAKGVSFDNCKKVNFFYGANGSGKSTISNYLQNQNLPIYSECSVDWENGIATDVVVYNRIFRERNFKENIDGVFTLGEATIEDIKHLEDLKNEREQKQQEIIKRNISLESKKNEELSHKNKFKETVWNAILKQNENDFKEAFAGYRADKEKFAKNVLSKYTETLTSSETKENLKKRALSLFESKPESCTAVSFDINTLTNELSLVENDDIWKKIIVGNKDVPIASLVEFLNNSDWVNQGRKFIQNQDICPFCQQKTITQDFVGQLNSFFSGEYEKDIAYIKELSRKYKDLTEQFIAIVNSAISDDKTVSIGQIDTIQYNSIRDLLIALFANNISNMLNKEKEAGQTVVLKDSTPAINELNLIINAANQNITAHNEMTANYIIERDKLSNDVWTFLLSEQRTLIDAHLKELTDFSKAIKGIQEGIERFKKEVDILDEKIVEAGKNITSIQPTVDEINRSSKAYGFTNFQIVASSAKENSYQVQRPDGSLATNTLSEGEETFISFLYFLQLAKGAIDAAKVSNSKILVLDDPICSLDSTILYIVSAMVKILIAKR